MARKASRCSTRTVYWLKTWRVDSGAVRGRLHASRQPRAELTRVVERVALRSAVQASSAAA